MGKHLEESKRTHVHGNRFRGRVVSRAGPKVLLDREWGTVHVVSPNPAEDTNYTVSWAKLAEDAGLDLVLPTLKMFACWKDSLISNVSPYRIPNRQDCFEGPNTGKWLITQCKNINIRASRDEKNTTMRHNGVWFCRNSIHQTVPDKVIIFKKFQDAFFAT